MRRAARYPRERVLYGPEFQREKRVVIEAEPWCHGTRVGPCRYPDAGSPANPLSGGHVVAGAVGGALVTQCRRCNSSARDRLG